MKLGRIAVIVTLFALGACNTVAGVGEDITASSRMVQGGLGGSGGY